MLYGGIYVVIIGLLLTTYSIIPLRNAIKSKRQLDGINWEKLASSGTAGPGSRSASDLRDMARRT